MSTIANHSSDLQLHYLKQEEYPIWDTFMQTSPQHTIYGQSWYLEILQCSFSILAVLKNQKIIAGIVLTKNSKNDYANPYLCKYLGIYYADFSGSTYHQETKRRKATRLLLSELVNLPAFDYFFHPKFATYLPFYEVGFENKVRYTYWIDLAQPLEQIEGQFSGKLRSEIRFAEQQAYQIVDHVLINDFVNICKQTFLQKNAKFPFTIAWLTSYCQQLLDRKAIKLVGIKNQKGQLMAATAILTTNETATLILSGIDKQTIQRGANELLIHHCIAAAKTYAKLFDFEGSMIPAIESFYRKFGGPFVPYLVIYKPSIRKFAFEKLRNWIK